LRLHFNEMMKFEGYGSLMAAMVVRAPVPVLRWTVLDDGVSVNCTITWSFIKLPPQVSRVGLPGEPIVAFGKRNVYTGTIENIGGVDRIVSTSVTTVLDKQKVATKIMERHTVMEFVHDDLIKVVETKTKHGPDKEEALKKGRPTAFTYTSYMVPRS
jgi:hypothetical protein